MPTIDALISMTFYGGLGYMGIAAIVHAFYWTEQRLIERQTIAEAEAVKADQQLLEAAETEQAQVALPQPPVKAKQKVTQPVYASF
ncbi:MAG: hypothetical protein F6K04_20280 [Leptolyngbya sp. SIO4C5]|uniref:hypothetical protein n=1 Tax=Sphaerothrix gracilis TaxID=3151835 RepID=UPI0013BF01EF|nr:hypothetical protein [Leptolyngbya sp. SIO4C5]